MEEFDLNIVHRPRKQHRNVDGLVRVYEGVGDVLEDDDFLNAMTINVKNVAKEILKNHSILRWHEVSNWNHEGDANTKCAQESK